MPFVNEISGTFGMPFGRVDDRKQSGYYASTSRQQNVPVVGDSSFGELHWTGEPHRQSHPPTHLAFNASSWPSTPFAGPSFSACEGSAWSGDQCFDAYPGTSSGALGGNVDQWGMRMGGTVVAAPVVEQVFPTAVKASPAFQPCSPPLNWTQASGSSWQPTHSWEHSHHSSSPGFPSTRSDNPIWQQGTSPVTTGHSERRFLPTGPLPSINAPNFVQPSSYGDPVPGSSYTPQSRGERWESSSTTMFQCLWSRRCTALITGNRRSITNHLRDEHNFACDGQMIACGWGDCMAYMQRRNIPRHIVTCHLAIKVTCPYCGLALSRADANKKHRLACPGAKTVMEATEEDEGGYL